MPISNVNSIEILLVEDDPSDVLLIKKAFGQVGLTNSLSVVGDGVEALEFLQRTGQFADAKRPDLIMLDLNMPRMDGREFLQQVKADEDTKRIPVIVLTTSDSRLNCNGHSGWSFLQNENVKQPDGGEPPTRRGKPV